MKTRAHTTINGKDCDLAKGHFNGGEHLFVDIDGSTNQTISCLLPGGKFVTFAFIPNGDGTIECVDIHTTAGQPFKYKATDEDTHYQQQAIGFCRGSDSFDTRDILEKGVHTGLITVLLHSNHNSSPVVA